jgi:hypothetical protein
MEQREDEKGRKEGRGEWMEEGRWDRRKGEREEEK